MREHLSRRLDELKVLARVIDGIVMARQTVVVALAIDRDGTKVPVGLWQGPTENAALCTALLQDLLRRGLRVEGRILCAIDGGKGCARPSRTCSARPAWSRAARFISAGTSRTTCPRAAKPTSVDAAMRQA
jgi:hypothetical protein